MAADGVVDLTESPDHPLQRAPKRPRAAEDSAVDLAAEEVEAKLRIMRHARRVNEERGRHAAAAVPCASGSGQGPEQAGGPGKGCAEQAGPVRVTNSLLAQLHAERMARRQQQQQQQQQEAQQQPGGSAGRAAARQLGPGTHEAAAGAPPPDLRLLSYNVWFREDLHVAERMAAIGAIVAARKPHVVCLQEVTPLIYRLLSSSAWWREYAASPCPSDAPYFTVLLWQRNLQCTKGCHSIPYANSVMGRDLKTVAVVLGGCPVRVATTHLESPVSGAQLFSGPRVAQCKQALELLDRAREPDVLFVGDMNLNPADGPPPLPGGWSDAWLHLHSGDPGLTYDPKANPMLKPGNRIRRRLDRAFVRLRRWRLRSMELVGREALPGLQFEGRPVLPSDHFGLFLTLSSGPASPASLD